MRSQFLFLVTVLCYSVQGFTQSSQNDSLPNGTLPGCIQYALAHQPHIQQSMLDEKIAGATIKSKLADWFPQISLDAYYQHNIKLPTNFFNGAYIANGTSNISSIGVSGTQNIFNPDVLLAARTSGDIKKAYSQVTDSVRIGTIAGVSKAFYDVLLTQRQISVLDEDIVRLDRSLQDAFNQYQG